MPGSPCYITEVNRRPAYTGRRFDEPSAQVPMQSRSVVEIELRGHNQPATVTTVAVVKGGFAAILQCVKTPQQTRGPAMRPWSHTPCSPGNMNTFPWVLCRPGIQTPGALLFHRSRLVRVSCGYSKDRKKKVSVEVVEDEA